MDQHHVHHGGQATAPASQVVVPRSLPPPSPPVHTVGYGATECRKMHCAGCHSLTPILATMPPSIAHLDASQLSGLPCGTIAADRCPSLASRAAKVPARPGQNPLSTIRRLSTSGLRNILAFAVRLIRLALPQSTLTLRNAIQSIPHSPSPARGPW